MSALFLILKVVACGFQSNSLWGCFLIKYLVLCATKTQTCINMYPCSQYKMALWGFAYHSTITRQWKKEYATAEFFGVHPMSYSWHDIGCTKEYSCKCFFFTAWPITYSEHFGWPGLKSLIGVPCPLPHGVFWRIRRTLSTLVAGQPSSASVQE